MDDFFAELQKKNILCKEKIQAVYGDLNEKSNLLDQSIILPNIVHPNAVCFRISLGSSDYLLSVSFPFDLPIGYYCETALFIKKDGIEKIHYDEKLGYDDVERWMTIDDLVTHINALVPRCCTKS
jgi:hypothetical protein